MMFGLDYLGGAKYQNVLVQSHPAGFAAGFFLNQFGNAIPTIDALLATGKCPLVRVHIVWEDNHHYNSAAHDPEIINGINKLNALKARHPQVEVQASPFCEHEISGLALAKLMAKVRAAAVNLTIVNCPDSHGAKYNGVVNELHSGKAAWGTPYNFSFDGLSCVDADIEMFKHNHQSAQVFFLWEPRFNGRWEADDHTPISSRDGWPDANLIKSVAYLAQSKSATKLPDKWLYKSHSEAGKNNPRSEHPVLISPIRTPSFQLMAGHTNIATLPLYGAYAGGGFRYYAPDWGYRLADKAKQLTGSPLVTISSLGKSYGTINPAFRDGDFRNN